MSVRLGFDVSPLYRPHPPGVVRATRGLVAALERRRVVEVVRLAPPTGADLRAWRHRELARAARERELAGLHSPVSAFPLWNHLRRVHTVHELPWLHGARENTGLAHRFWSRVATHRADAVVAPSAFVARDLARAGVFAARTVQVVPWGVDASFTPDGPRSPEFTDAVLLPGAARAKKNAEAALRAVAMLPAARRPRVVITGAASDADRARLRAVSAIEPVFAGELDDAALAAAYRSARAVLVLSRSEGFAFPVVEAFACGAPVIAARGTAQAELAGAAGLVVDADDGAEVARALERAADERDALADRGLERKREFTWDRAAERVEALWKELLA